MGDIVLVPDQDTPHNLWPLGHVIEATKDADGLVRRVKVAIQFPKLDSKGKSKAALTVLERPIQKLILVLETDENAE